MNHPLRAIIVLCAAFFFGLQSFAQAQLFLVEDGIPKASIVIAEDPPRSTHLAARELQQQLEKISGATLDITTEGHPDLPVTIYVGESPALEKLGVTAEGLEHGAYRIVSGKNWIALIGDDTDFVPIEPWPRSNNDLVSGKMQDEWSKITGKSWGYTHSQLHKHYSGRNALFGTPDEQKTDEDGNIHVWTYDERGSFNAVCGFLRGFGMRWYLPGELGEVVPEMDSIPLPQVDKTVTPDFPMRILNFRAAVYGREAMMWGFRLGVRQPWGRQAAHGLVRMTDNEWTLKNKPEWFALYGGKRHVQPLVKNHQLCYSNEELLSEAVAFAQAQFDHFDMDAVSIMPPDGYTAICQCELCEGKESPELGARGMLSNYVWEFVNQVAKEVAKSHPDKLISNCAYGIYTEPPSNIDRLEPNVQVIIVGGRRPTSADRDDLRRLRSEWAAKTDRPLEIFENYPLTGRGFYLPAYIPRVMGESINETKAISRGEDIWLTMDFGDDAIGYNHFLIYFTARMYWGGEEQDAKALFDEYCDLFYGPAAGEMRTFFAYCEEHWREMESDEEKAGQALALFAAAQAKAEPGSLFGKRIGLIDNYLEGLRNKRKQLSQKRGPVPTLRMVSGDRGKIVVDGRLDERAWLECPVATRGQLRELQTGRQPIYGTSFKAAWIGNDLCFAIRCEEHPGGAPNTATTKNGDQAIWYGDAVEILLDTDSHHYYQIVVNPAGALVDLDRGADRRNWFNWSSQAEVATHVADDHWIAEIRIPITADENDPLHQVVGRRPTKSLPWHINVCRQRIRDNGSEFSAFSPTGTSGFHEPMKFAHFFAGNSHRFPADESVSDYLIASRAANDLMRARKFEEALAAYLALAESDKITDFQKADALQHAASCARSLKNVARADELATRIPIEAVAKTVQMENRLVERKWKELAEQFGGENFATWPFWQRGAGAFARAKAHVFLKNGEKAEADLQTALAYTADSRIRLSILATMGGNRETNLGDEDGALDSYRQNYESKERIGGADEFRSVERAAAILTRWEKYDEALDAISRADLENLKGHWRSVMLLSRGNTLSAAGRKEDALEAYRQIFADDTASDQHRKQAEEAIEALEAGDD